MVRVELLRKFGILGHELDVFVVSAEYVDIWESGPNWERTAGRGRHCSASGDLKSVSLESHVFSGIGLNGRAPECRRRQRSGAHPRVLWDLGNEGQ